VTPELDRIRPYLLEALGVVVSPTRWPDEGRLPLLIRDRYAFHEVEILGLPCLLMVDQGTESPSAATIRKQMDQIRPKWPGELVYVRGQVVAYQRKRLIEQKVPFIVPGNQMYLPMLAIDLREHFRRLRQTPSTLSPATQAVVLHALLCGEQRIGTPAVLAERLGYTKMTMTRAFDQLDAAGLGDVSKQGRQRWLTMKDSRRDFWQEALPFLRTPAKQRKQIRRTTEEPIGPVAGLSALAKYSMLSAPSIPTLAISANRWKAIQRRAGFQQAASDDPDSQEIEIWTYDPGLFARSQVVDRFSLFLSLRGSKDERVETALEEMMEEQPW
jgi:DNA-binding MarR family transcriptional regulator